jgi:hypothetical protein
LNSIIENKSKQETNANQYNKAIQKNKYKRNYSRNYQNKYKQNFDQRNYKNPNYDQQYYEKSNNERNSKRFICNSEEHLAISFSNNWSPKALQNENYQSQRFFTEQ